MELRGASTGTLHVIVQVHADFACVLGRGYSFDTFKQLCQSRHEAGTASRGKGWIHTS